MSPAYDYLIVGAGLYGSVFAYEATQRGKRCLVLEKRAHVGGNIYTENIEGIDVHVYGAHIFHTSSKAIWNYVKNFCEFNNFINSPVARWRDKLYNLPFNMNTFHEMWGVKTPQDAEKIIQEQRESEYAENPVNLEEQAINLVGRDIYERLIKGYTEKQWGRSCKDLPAFIIKRLPVRFTYDNNYYNDRYQGIPVNGYTSLIEKMLGKSEVKLNVNFNANREVFCRLAKKIIYTGPIDEYFNYEYGPLSYRSVRFETEILDVSNYQGCAVVNYTEREIPYTRIIEHKHFNFGKQPRTVISREYPLEWKLGIDPYYPVNDEVNTSIFNKYKQLASAEDGVTFGGRLGNYQYYDMDKVIAKALDDCVREFS